jgi:hypothetical protein
MQGKGVKSSTAPEAYCRWSCARDRLEANNPHGFGLGCSGHGLLGKVAGYQRGHLLVLSTALLFGLRVAACQMKDVIVVLRQDDVAQHIAVQPAQSNIGALSFVSIAQQVPGLLFCEVRVEMSGNFKDRLALLLGLLFAKFGQTAILMNFAYYSLGDSNKATARLPLEQALEVGLPHFLSCKADLPTNLLTPGNPAVQR